MIKTIISNYIKKQNKNKKSTKYKLNTKTINSLKSKLKQSFNKNITKIILQYINTSLKHQPNNITKHYIYNKTNPKQLLITSKTQLLNNLTSLTNTIIN